MARLVFEGQPVSWLYDAQGDGDFESKPSYTLNLVGEDQLFETFEAFKNRKISPKAGRVQA